jgi:hypothetical protein
MRVACRAHVRSFLRLVLLALAFTLCSPAAVVAATDTESAQKNRRKPLQRCDQLKGDAELECLQKARERVVEARKKRETGATNAEAEKGTRKDAGATKAEAQKSARKQAASPNPEAEKGARKETGAPNAEAEKGARSK